MTGAILLRVLSFNSTIKFGKYADLTVNDLINIKKHGYLWWLYYNVEGISFSDEVLDKIKLFPEERIKKPGSFSAGYDNKIDRVAKFKCAAQNSEYLKGKAHSDKELRIRSFNKENSAKIFMKKSVLMAKNHGH